MSRTNPASLFLALLLTAAISVPARAQTVEGRLVDDATGAPVAQAQVAALDARGRVVRSAETGVDGGFTLVFPAAGRYAIRASRLGYQPVTTLEVAVAAGDPLSLEVHIATGAVPLAPLTITVRKAPPADPELARRGFYTRKAAYEQLGARFMDREEVRRRNAFRATDVFRDVPGVRVRPGSGRSAILTLRGSCEASVFIDGLQVNRMEVSRDQQTSLRAIRDGMRAAMASQPNDAARSTGVDPVDRVNIDDVVAASSISAIEIYQTSQVPAEFTNFQARPCGVIVIWTGFAPASSPSVHATP
jgi:hypothetical protein